MTDDQHYDVIIIGTGAGGGTLAHRLAPTGKRVLLLERGDYLPRERDNWDSTAVFVQGKYRAPEFWSTSTATSSRPRSTTTSAATPSSTAPRCSGCAPRTSARSATTTASRRPGRSATRTWSRTTPRPSTSTWCTASTARTPPRGRPARQYAYPAGRARAAHPAAQRRPGEAGPAPLPPADRGQPDPGRPGRGDPRQRLHPLRPGRRLPLPGRREVRRAGHLRRPRAARTTTSSWSPTPTCERLETDATGRTVTAVVAELGGRLDRRSSPPTSWSSPAAR